MSSSSRTLRIDPHPRFALSPYRFMQFMEPLGTTDGSVEAGWDFDRPGWREDLLDATRALAPTLIRWPGGILSSYYRWREGVGPRSTRRPMLNLLWGGMESNQVGTHEFIQFCRQVGADPLIAINFGADGNRRWARTASGDVRAAGPDEAAAWVDYCNNPANPHRHADGYPEPYRVQLWQIGNETSYVRDGWDAETSALRTRAFAEAMRQADPTIDLIGWGDSGWAPALLDVAGDQLQFIAFHHHFGSGLDDSPLAWNRYREDPARTWEHLMHAWHSTDAKLREMREAIAGWDGALALTESHFALPGRNRCDVLATWAAGVAHARILHVHERHGDVLKIATLADFCGTRWMNNAVMIPTPRGNTPSYLMPVGRVMALYRHHSGDRALDVVSAPAELDVTASRTGNTVFVHVVNTDQTRATPVTLEVADHTILSGELWEITDDPRREIDHSNPDLFTPIHRPLTEPDGWVCPPASVSALEIAIDRGELSLDSV
jgi:alpha-L-arabinofuranosidase